MSQVYRNVVERRLLKRRGERPAVVEILNCGHVMVRPCAAHWVTDKRFPTARRRQRMCARCMLGDTVNDNLDGEIILKETFDLLTDLAKAVKKAEDAAGTSG